MRIVKKATALALALILGGSLLTGCSGKEIRKECEKIMEYADSVDLEWSGSAALHIGNKEGEKAQTCIAFFNDYTNTEHLFKMNATEKMNDGGVHITYTVKARSGSAELFWTSAGEETGVKEHTIGAGSGEMTLPSLPDSIGIRCEDFSGRVKIRLMRS